MCHSPPSLPSQNEYYAQPNDDRSPDIQPAPPVRTPPPPPPPSQTGCYSLPPLLVGEAAAVADPSTISCSPTPSSPRNEHRTPHRQSYNHQLRIPGDPPPLTDSDPQHIPRLLDRLMRGHFHALFRQRIAVTLLPPNGASAILLRHRAVNDVMVSEKQCSNALYTEVSVDGGKKERQKSSGIIVCTGTGSSAWAFNISKVQADTVQCVIDAFLSTQPTDVVKNIARPDVEEVKRMVNAQLLFHPSTPTMRYVVREPIENRVFAVKEASGGLCRELTLKPLSREAFVFIDGLHKFRLPVGYAIKLYVQPDDIVWTAK
eukprot:GHVS01051562.1.p1 GENE.GHVS01051562.1~~GHVS01051562.1.p1  ORF type:complete len:368 (-),score=68.75 GHVS01051562.1:271-1218(-)